MKIFIVCPRLCYGGAERVGVMLANGFASRGNEVTMVANLFDDITYSVDENNTIEKIINHLGEDKVVLLFRPIVDDGILIFKSRLL